MLQITPDIYDQWDEQLERFLKGEMNNVEESSFLMNLDINQEKKRYVVLSTILKSEVMNSGKMRDDMLMEAIRNASDEVVEIVTGKPQLRDDGLAAGSICLSRGDHEEQTEEPDEEPVEMPAAACAEPTEITAAAEPIEKPDEKPYIAAFVYRENISLSTLMVGITAIAAVVACFIIINHSLISSGTMDFATSDIVKQVVFTRGGSDSTIANDIARISANIEKKQFIASSILKLEEYYQLATNDTTDEADDYAYEIGLNLAKAYILNEQNDDAERILEEMQKEYPKDDKIRSLLNKLTRTFFWE